MSELTVVLGIGKCLGGAAEKCIPEEVKDRVKQPVTSVIKYQSNVAKLPDKIEALEHQKAAGEKWRNVAETNEKEINFEISSWLRATNEILEKKDIPQEGNCFCKNACELNRTLEDINKKLEEAREFPWASVFPAELAPIGSIYNNPHKKLQSREDILEKILNALNETDANIISITGMPGIGKTTLLQELVKHATTGNMFDVIAKATVSQTPDVKRIQQSIATRISLNLPQQDDEETRASTLFTQLERRLKKNKRILILLDDICNERGILWGRFGIPCRQQGKLSCKILLASRNLELCKMMGSHREFSLRCLDSYEAKMLFQESVADKIPYVEFERESYKSFEEDVLRQCAGLPKAITVMAEKVKLRWPNCSDVKQLWIHCMSEVGVPTVTESFKLSFDLLEPKRQKFFLLCSLFEQGTGIVIEHLMRYGIGLCLSEHISLKHAIEEANAWINDLISLSLLEDKDKLGHVSMHPVMRDIAISFAHQAKYVLQVEVSFPWRMQETYRNYTVIFMMPDANYKDLESLKLQKLEALILKSSNLSVLPDNFFVQMQKLKVLELFGMTFSTLPSSIQGLRGLIMLSLEDCNMKDVSMISHLKSLRVLSLRKSTIEALPEEIGDLSNLILLDLNCCYLRTIPSDSVARLTNLEGLYMNDVYNSECVSCGASLLCSLNLASFSRLNVLEIELSSNWLAAGDFPVSDLSRFKIAIGGKLPEQEKHSSLSRVLYLKRTEPTYLRKHGLKVLLEKTECLHVVEIEKLMKILYDLDADGFKGLKQIYITKCNQMNYIINTVGLGPQRCEAFSELEILCLEYLPKLEGICNGPVSCNIFPKLQEVKLLHLKRMNRHVFYVDQMRELRVMEVSDCNNLNYIFTSHALIQETGRSFEIHELPCLKKLHLQNMLSLLSLCDGEENSTPRNDLQINQPFFQNKIKLPALEEVLLEKLDKIEELWDFVTSSKDSAAIVAAFPKLQFLTLRKMPNLRHVWREKLCEGSPSFQSLKKMKIDDCRHIKGLFPPSVPAALPQLECLKIASCHEMEFIIGKETDDDNDPTSKISFPKLQKLKLDNLRSLKCFYQGRFELQFPCLKDLILCALPTMLMFVEHEDPNNDCCQTIEANIIHDASCSTKQFIFNGKVLFPSLECLELKDALQYMEGLVVESHAEETFPKLKFLTINNLPNLRHIPETILGKVCSLFVHQIPWLKYLFATSPDKGFVLSHSELTNLGCITIEECDSLESLIDEVELAVALPSLKKLAFIGLSNLREIPWYGLANIRSLEIHGVPCYTSLFSSVSFVTDDFLQELQSLSVKDCKNLVEIVLKEVIEDRHAFRYGVNILPKLNSIELNDLPRLCSFSSGTYETTFLSLKGLKINRCPNIQSFSKGDLLTPKLTEVLVNEKSLPLSRVDCLNVVLQDHFKQQHRQGEASVATERVDGLAGLTIEQNSLEAISMHSQMRCACGLDANSITVLD